MHLGIQTLTEHTMSIIATRLMPSTGLILCTMLASGCAAATPSDEEADTSEGAIFGSGPADLKQWTESLKDALGAYYDGSGPRDDDKLSRIFTGKNGLKLGAGVPVPWGGVPWRGTAQSKASAALAYYQSGLKNEAYDFGPGTLPAADGTPRAFLWVSACLYNTETVETGAPGKTEVFVFDETGNTVLISGTSRTAEPCFPYLRTEGEEEVVVSVKPVTIVWDRTPKKSPRIEPTI